VIVLDTNVLSELMQRSPHPVVLDWMDRQARDSIWITSITVFEVRTGLDFRPLGRRRDELEASFARVLEENLSSRVLPLDTPAAVEAGRIAAVRRRRGFSDDPRDTLIAGIVVTHGATLVTRNLRHFVDIVPMVINPWSTGLD
jgi:hypothetical protein